MSLSSGTIERRALRCRRAYKACRAAFLKQLRGWLMSDDRFSDPLCSPFGRASRLIPGKRHVCPLMDHGVVVPVAGTYKWKGFLWTTALGQCCGCGTIYYSKPMFSANNYLGRASEKVRNDFLKKMGAA
jgi:hypothetical protein